MTRDDSPRKEVAMETHNFNQKAPLATFATTPIDDEIIYEDTREKKRGGTFPRMARFNVPETPPESQNGTLKAKETHKPQRQNGSLKGPWNSRRKGVPAMKADTAKVLEIYLKRRSKSLNDAVLTREYFAQEKKQKRRSARNNTISVCSTISTDSYVSEGAVQPESTAETTSDVDKTVFSREKGTQKSFHEAMKCPIMEDSSTMEQSADDELSSSDETSPRSRSAPSTLRMQVKRDDMDTLKLRDRENGTATLTRDGYKRDSKKEPKRKRSFLDKAKQIIRSPSTTRKIERTPSASQRLEEMKEEKEKEKERQKKEKEEKEKLEKRLKEERERKEREKELREKKEKEKELQREQMEREVRHARNEARSEVHCEMKKTGFTARLKQTFRRSSRDKHRDKEHSKSKGGDAAITLEAQGGKEVKTKRWPSFQFKRKSRKSASTPTDESGACATTPSDTASMDFEYFSTRPDHTRSLNDAERRKLIVEMRRGATRETSGNASDSQLLDNTQARHPPLGPAMSNDSFASFASSEGSEQRPERPRTLAFRRTRAERAQRGLNDVIRLEDTTPGHVRRDVDTSAPVLPFPAALLADDVVRDCGPNGHQGAAGGGATDSWTESGDGSDIPFDQRNQADQEQFFKRIADRLALIGDQALAEYNFAEAGGAVGGQQRAPQLPICAEPTPSCSAAVAGASGSTTRDHQAEYNDIGERIRTDVDGIQMRRRSMAVFPAPTVMGVIVNDTYQVFCDAMQSIVGQDVGWEQLAIVFKFTKVAVKAAQSMGKRANGIKDNSIRFIGDRFAVWLDSQGGYGSVVTSEDSDSLHEESEID
ncbi:uncharacterized protein [Diadema antillarum]|uniref:uncharacterized protein isoform X1 n=1 Tax=Diadema antillarum TaxID=105358 RepID=UPI003A89A065